MIDLLLLFPYHPPTPETEPLYTRLRAAEQHVHATLESFYESGQVVARQVATCATEQEVATLTREWQVARAAEARAALLRFAEVVLEVCPPWEYLGVVTVARIIERICLARMIVNEGLFATPAGMARMPVSRAVQEVVIARMEACALVAVHHASLQAAGV